MTPSVYPPLSDNILFQQIRHKDLDAFNELYHRLASSLLETAFQKTTDRFLAQDLVQELFVWLWEEAANIKDTAVASFDIKGYMHVALRNKIYNHYHRQLRAVAAVNELKHTTPDTIEDTAAYLEYQEVEMVVEAEIEALPSEMKKIFRLRKQHELSIKEIAEQLVLSEQTVKNQLGIATRRLRLSLEKASIVTVILIQISPWYFCLFPLLNR